MKFCSKCGAELEAEDRFCTNCGAAVDDVQADAGATAKVADNVESKIKIDSEAVNQKVKRTQKYALSYWQWLKTSIEKPFEIQADAHPFYGLTTFILLSMLGALLIVVPGHQIFISATQGTSNLTNNIMENPFSFGLFLKLFLIIGVIYALYVIVGFATIKLLGDEVQSVSWSSYTNDFAHLINYTIIFSALAVLMASIFLPNAMMNSSSTGVPSSVKFIALLLALAGLGFNTGFLATLFNTKLKFKIDRIYVVVIAQIVIAIVIYIVVQNVLIPAVQSYVTNLISSTMDSLFGGLGELFGS